jgi:GPH family glycoside/pentoside/hexuronide:cation symporter
MKVGTGIGAALVGWTLSFGRFDPALAVQDTQAMNAIIFLYLYLPLVIYVLCGIVLWFYKLDKQLPQILSDLKERHLGGM